MNIIQLTYFKCVVDEMSVTKAARKLHVTQSAVSQQIHLLAEDLGCQLFHRKGRNLQVTQLQELGVEMSWWAVADALCERLWLEFDYENEVVISENARLRSPERDTIASYI